MATYYVSTAGSDGNDGTSIGTAKATVAAGVALLAAGDTLEILDGLYEIDATVVVTVPGVTIRGYQGAMPELRRASSPTGRMWEIASTAVDCTIENLHLNGNRAVSSTTNGIEIKSFPTTSGTFQVLNCILRSFSHSVIAAGNYVFLIVRGTEIVDAAFNTAMTTAYGGGGHFEGNYHHDSNANFCSIHSNHLGSIVVGNIITDGYHYGVQTSAGGIVRNNIIGGTVQSGVVVVSSERHTRQVTIENNIIYNCGQYGINAQWTGGPVRTPMIGRNAFYNNTSGNYNGVLPGDGDVLLTEDPFVDAANGDYSLTPAAQKLLTYGTPSTWPGSTTPQSRLAIGAWQPRGGGIDWPLIRRIAAMGDLRFGHYQHTQVP